MATLKDSLNARNGKTMEEMAADILLKRGKRYMAKSIKEECLANHPIKSLISVPRDDSALSQILHVLFNPHLNFISADMIDWVKWLVAGGLLPQEFGREMKKFDNSITCGQVWFANVVAFRCRTCSISPCMSLCPDCFNMGDHTGHDFNMFKSKAGGACDCGDSSVMERKGFCSRHGCSGKRNLTPPLELTASAEAILPRVFHRFVIMCRKLGATILDEVKDTFAQADPFFEYLEDLLEIGGAMRAIITNILLSKQFYQESLNPPEAYEHHEKLILYRENYYANVSSMPAAKSPIGFEDIKYMNHQLDHQTLLDEIIFWMVKFEFPQKLVCFLLNMRPDTEYEKEFARSFLEHYSRVSKSISNSEMSEALCNSIVHVSVQLFSDQDLALRMASNYNLLYILILSIRDMMAGILRQANLYDGDNSHKVVDCNTRIMKNHNYWPLVSDLNNILSSKQIALLYIKDDRLANIWHSLVRMFQGMNVNIRETGNHVEFEPQSYYAAFSAESEACASPMWTIAAHMTDPEVRCHAISMTSNCLKHILIWFEEINFNKDLMLENKNRLSFHFPLHRLYAILLWNDIKYLNVHREDILPDSDIMEALVLHPISVQVGFYDVICGGWVRNGLQVKGQAITYIQCHFSNSMVDADLFLIQLGAMFIQPDTLLRDIIILFKMNELLHLSERKSSWISKRSLLESFLIFMATVVTTRTYTDADDYNISLREMAALLTMHNRTHSYLIAGMPERSSSEVHVKNFEGVLEELSVFHKPVIESCSGSAQQGMYQPKPEVWMDRYDPLHVLLRAVHRKDYQSSFDRFKFFCRANGKVANDRVQLWPPYRLPCNVHPGFEDPRRLISCGTFQAILLIFLYKFSNEEDPPDNILSLIIFLLELIVDYQAKNNYRAENTMDAFCERSSSGGLPTDGNPKDWFKTDDIFVNATVVIDRVKMDLTVKKGPFKVFEGPSTNDEDDIAPMDTYSEESLPPDYDEAMARPLAAGNELVPYGEHASSLVASHNESRVHSDRSPNVELPEGDPRLMAIDNDPSVEGNETENAALLPPPSYRALLSGSEVVRHFDVPASDDDLDTLLVVRQTEDNAEVAPTQRVRRHAGNPPRAISSSEPTSAGTFSSCLALSILKDGFIDTDCSIISLLLKLHSKLSGRPGSYKPDLISTDDSRIGDGAFFVAKLLNKLGRYNKKTACTIVSMKRTMYYQKHGMDDDEEEHTAEMEDKKRKLRAKERRKKVLAQFAEQQKHFLQKNTSDYETSEMGTDGYEENEEPEYDCVICSQTTPSTCEEPVGLITYAQSTSILAYKSDLSGPPMLPDTYKDLQPSNVTLLGKYMDEKAMLLRDCFGRPAIMAINSGWEGGVHVQTCGHHLHLECHKSYLQTLRSQPRNNIVKHEIGEFMCPLCRQLANCILPVGADIPKISTQMTVPFSQSEDREMVIDRCLKNVVPPTFSEPVTCAMARLMENLTRATYTQCRTKAVDPATSTLFMFVSSIVRTNLEIELVQRGGNLVNQRETPRRKLRSSHLMPMMYTLGFHSKILGGLCGRGGGSLDHSRFGIRQLWSSITLNTPEGFEKAIISHDIDVPLLFRDPITILLQFVMMLPLKFDLYLLDCIMTNIYKLAVIRATADQLSQLTDSQRRQLLDDGPLAPLFSMVHLHLRDSPLLKDDTKSLRNTWTPEHATNEVRENCLEFLRIAALLKAISRQQKVPFIVEHVKECGSLEQFIGVFDTCSVINSIAMGEMCGTLNSVRRSSSSQPGFTFDTLSPVETRIGTMSLQCRNWCSEVVIFAAKSQCTAASLLSHKRFFPCRLLRFPSTYDDLFQRYYKKLCYNCSKIPKKPGICLVCGMLVCLRDSTSDPEEISEATKHAVDCGAGTALYLAIMKSYVYVVRGTRYLCWGSLHLDMFGEEDKDLKRGKPLFLNQNRLDLLEELWVNLRFDSIGRKWSFNRDFL